MKKCYLLFIFLFLFKMASFATHNRAGEITFRALDTINNPCLIYEITITTYTKCESVADRCSIPVDFGDGTKGEFSRVNGLMGPGSFDLCNHTCNGQNVGESLDSRTKKNIYRGVHTYLGPSDYWISFEDPNRDAGIINLGGQGSASVNIPFYIKSLLVISPFLGTNSSPVLTYPPIDNACLNGCFYHNPAAFDKDGDSLSYELTTCFTEGGNNIPDFSQPDFYGGGTLTMDTKKGDLSWCLPTRIGEYNAAFFIKEWRKVNNVYYIIGEVERDMQIDVINCPVGIKENEQAKIQLTILPDPVNEFMVVHISTSESLPGNQLIIADILGRKIIQIPANSNDTRIPRSAFSPGVFVGTIIDVNGHKSVTKFVVNN